MLICPEASKAQNSMAAVSADGSTVWVLILRLNSSCTRSIALYAVPHGGNRLLEPGRSVNDEEIRPLEIALDEVVENRAPGLAAMPMAGNPGILLARELTRSPAITWMRQHSVKLAAD